MVSVCEDILRPLLDAELQALLDLFAKRTHEKSYHYFSIYNQLKWNNQLENVSDKDSPKWNRLKREFYSHRNGNLLLTGTFVSILRERVISVSFHTFEPSMKELRECLERTQLIDWKEGPLLEGVHMDLSPFITEIICKRNAVIEHDRLSLYFLLSKRKINNFPDVRIPEGYQMKPLTKENAEEIHAVWPNNKEGSVDFIRGILTLNKGLGIFKTGNKIVAWVLQNEFAGIGVLQTVCAEQGKGFGTALVIEMCRKIVNTDDLDVNAFTTSKNLKSQALLKKLGFEVVEYAKWTKYKKVKG